jgi:hypothetical protein
MSLAATQSAFVAMLRSDDKTGLSAGQAIYHNAYRRRLIEALAEVYDKTWTWIGDDNFEQAARAHVGRTPPQSWTLNDYGGGFAQTLADLFPDDPEVAELARLEWALHTAFAGPNADPVDPAVLVNIDWSVATLHFVPTVQFFPLSTNAPALWAALKQSQTPPSIETLADPASAMVWRKGFEPHFRTIDMPQADAINRLRAGVSFAAFCDELATHSADDTTATVATWLRSWIADGLICDIRSV